MTKLTQAELEARAAAMIPSQAVLQRGRFVDGEDILESTKERVGRVVHSSIEAPYYLAHLCLLSAAELVGELQEALAVVVRCVEAMPKAPAAVVSTSSLQEDVASALNEEANKREAAIAKVVAATKAFIPSSTVQLDSSSAPALLEKALPTIREALEGITLRVANFTNVIESVAQADFHQWVVSRQLRKLQKLTSSESSTNDAVDILIAGALLDVNTFITDFAQTKYTGVINASISNARKCEIVPPAPPLAIRLGDYIVDGAITHTIVSFTGNYIFFDNPWYGGTGTLQSKAAVDYAIARPGMYTVLSLCETALLLNFEQRARTAAYANTGHTAFLSAVSYLESVCAEASRALDAFSVAIEEDVATLLEALREERQLHVLSLLETLDFPAITAMDGSELSEIDAVATELEAMAAELGAGSGGGLVYDAPQDGSSYREEK